MQIDYQTQTPFCYANYFVIAFVPILFFITAFLGYLHLLPLHVPIHSIVMLGLILFVFLLFIRHNANYSICKMRATHGSVIKALTEKLALNSLTIHTQTKSILDIEKFLNAYYSDVRNDNFASIGASIFPMLGILGTFIAIAISMPNFSVSDTQALDHEISLLLSGVGSAFLASIYGILLSLIWTYFEKRGMSKVHNFFSLIEDELSYKVWSQDELTIYKYTQYDLKQNKFLAAMKETFSLDFIQELNVHQQKSYEKVMADTNTNFAQIAQTLLNVSRELQNTLTQLNHNNNAIKAQAEIEQSIRDFTNTTKSFERTMQTQSSTLNHSLNQTFDKIDNEIGQIVIKLADFASHVSLESSAVQESIAAYHAAVAQAIKEH